MKAVSKLVVLFSLGALASVAASASTLEQSYLESCRKDPGVPVPVAVVSPTVVGSEYNGTTVELEFVVDEQGKTANLSVKSAPDKALAAAVTDAVKQWKFKPAERNGVPVATKVALPVKIVAPDISGETYASN
jgi:periplasmic protein TonB